MKIKIAFKEKSMIFLCLVLQVLLFNCSSESANVKEGIELQSSSTTIEALSTSPLVLKMNIKDAINPTITFSSDAGKIESGSVKNVAYFTADEKTGKVNIKAKVQSGTRVFENSLTLEVVAKGALKKTAMVTITVDANALKSVWVDAAHPKEVLHPPLKLKGTFRYDPETLEAFSGGSWPVFDMYDDGTHGDKTAKDNIWSIALNFEKSDAKVYIAFDDNSPFRVQFESGFAWRLKSAWIPLDDFPDDNADIALIPDKDQELNFTKEMALKAGISLPQAK